MRSFDPRPAPLLDDTPDADAPTLQSDRRYSRRRKAALIALGNGDHEILCPAPAEIDEDGASAFPNRQHLALDDRETAARGGDRRRLVRPHDAINRLRPHAKLGFARLAFACQQLHPGSAALDEIRLDPALGAVFGNEEMNEQAPVAVLLGADPPQRRRATDERPQNLTGTCIWRSRRGVDAGKPHLAAAIEQQGASVDDP